MEVVPWLAPLAVFMLVGVLGFDTLKIGFFADDFHFLDVARRIPLWSALGGAYGIHPWFRPISTVLYFGLVAFAGPAGLPLAHLLSLACVGSSAWTLRAIGLRLTAPRPAAIATVLYLTYAITKFLAAWASGFQDLLGLLLVLLAVRAQLEAKPWRATLAMVLGVFAKETAFVAFPIVLIASGLFLEGRRRWVWGSTQVVAFVASVAVHVWVRMRWPAHAPMPRLVRSPVAVVDALGRMAGGLVGIPVSASPTSYALAAIAMGATFLLLMDRASGSPVRRTAGEWERRAPTPERTVAFLSLAALLGVSPLVLGQISALGRPQEYYTYFASPWLALLMGLGFARLAPRPGKLVMVALAGWNTLAMSFAPVDLSTPAGWKFDRWDWPEAIRFSAKAGRLRSDLRMLLSSRPESLVVLYTGMDNGGFFQSEDGPATRECLGDPTVRSHWLSRAPYGLQPGRFEILVFNLEARHLERHRLPRDYRYDLAARSLAAGRTGAAWALASYGDTVENSRFEFGYLRLATALIEGDSTRIRAERTGLGMTDTSPVSARSIASRALGSANPLEGPLAACLRTPGNAAAHASLAEAYSAAGAGLEEAIELRLATTLGPYQERDRLRLDRLLFMLGESDSAREDLAKLVASTPGAPVAEEARWLIEHQSPVAETSPAPANPH